MSRVCCLAMVVRLAHDSMNFGVDVIGRQPHADL